MTQNVVKLSQLQLPLDREADRNGRNPQDIDGVVPLRRYLADAAALSVSTGLSHNVYCEQCVSGLLDIDGAEGKKPKGELYLHRYINRRIELLVYLTKNNNPNIKNRRRRIRQAVAELQTHWQLINEVRNV